MQRNINFAPKEYLEYDESMTEKTYINDNFLLDTSLAAQLYHEHAEGMPIVDYHAHLDPFKIVQDYHFSTITELWLKPGEYKWRAMRANGVPEYYITGGASDWEKFEKWAETLPYLLRNPLYAWTHMELKQVFGIDKVLNPSTAKEIYDECNEKLQSPEFSMQSLIKRFKVKAICTANDVMDSLEYHKIWRSELRDFKMFPTWKPDRLFELDDNVKFNRYIDQLSDASDIVIRTYGSLLEALRLRHAHFHAQGCRLSDISIDCFYVEDYSSLEIDEIFSKLIHGKSVTCLEQNKFKAALLMDLCEMDYKTSWVQQYHIGVQTDLNTTMFKLLGRHSGFDGMNDRNVGVAMGKYFDRLFERGILCRTIVYNLNAKDFEMFAVILGSFQDGSYPGKLQLGPAWWYLNNDQGMQRQLDALSSHGVLSRFIGMATDSHCVLSYCRHDYFRRYLCNILGDELTRGKLPMQELPRIEQMVEDICYKNAKNFINV